MIQQHIRPAPYYSTNVTERERHLAAALRVEFVDKISRRLPGHHLKGFKHDFIVNFIKEKKKQYPFFFRTDIACFFPNIKHKDLIVFMQLAYRDLLNLDYVPKTFKRKFVPAMNEWCKGLPTEHCGIPVGSPVSAIAAPVMLVPLWLELKRNFNLPFLIFMDDIFILCPSQDHCAWIYTFLENKLHAYYELQMNISKTVSGQFSKQPVDFCGWNFSGGYARITDKKINAFKARLLEDGVCKQPRDTRSYIKCINRKIDGFGNYYKHGDVCKQFAGLDVFIRNLVRDNLCTKTKQQRYDNDQLQKIGLHSLEFNYRRLYNRKLKTLKPPCPPVELIKTLKKETKNDDTLRQTELLEIIQVQLTQLLSFQRKQLNAIQAITSTLQF